jgi:glycosyltransferase involved in cell wall biosynthesis
MKILIPIVSFTRFGGARVLSELANQWLDMGHQVAFISAQSDLEPYFPTRADIVYGTARADTPLWKRILLLRRMVRERTDSSTIVLANHHLTAWAVWLAGARCRRRAFYYIQAYEPEYHSDHPSRWRGRVLTGLARLSYALLPRQIVNAPLYYDYPGITAIDWIPPGIDPERFYPEPRPPQDYSASRPMVLGCIGRHEPWKGTGDVFDALRLLRQRGAPVTLRSAYNVPAGYDDLSDGVAQVIPANDAELGEFYRSCDVMIAPGWVQLGAPHYPVIEAMACGVPVITTGYMPADAANAWLVPVRDAGAIADTVEAMLREPQMMRLRAERGLQQIAGFAWPELARRFVALFDQHAGRA